jgi:magnesium transporter
MKKLSSTGGSIFENANMNAYFDSLLEQSKEIWEMLENQKENIEALHNTNESLISFKLNSIMKTLTIISVLVFPATLVSSMFGMNFMIPFQSSNYGFLGAVIVIAICMILLFLYFRKKKWLD